MDRRDHIIFIAAGLVIEGIERDVDEAIATAVDVIDSITPTTKTV
jgi:hypothetical protein